jgi:hypothetical protein
MFCNFPKSNIKKKVSIPSFFEGSKTNWVLVGRGWDKNLWGTKKSIVEKFMRLNLDFSVDKCELFQAKLLFSNPFRRVKIGWNCDKNNGGTPYNIVEKFICVLTWTFP